MLFSQNLTTLLAFFSLNLILAENKTIFSKHEELPIATTSGSLLESVVTYSACEDVETSSDGKNSRKCKIIHGNMVEKSELPSCDITFQGKLSENYTVHSLSDDRMVMVWCDDDEQTKENLLRYTFIHLPDCKTAEATVSFDNHEILSSTLNNYGEALTFNEDGTYDVFFENPKFCDKKICRMTIDSQGKVVKGPTAAYLPTEKVVVVTESKAVNNSIGLAELGIDSENTRVSLITSDGLKVLREFKNGEWGKHDVTVEHGMIRGCSVKGDKQVECEIFDANGKSLSKSAVDLGNFDFHQIAIANLPNGEFILLTETKNGQHSNITKYDSNNKRIGSASLPEFKCDDDSMVAIKDIHKENNLNCVSKLCYDFEHADMSKDCFGDGELK